MDRRLYAIHEKDGFLGDILVCTLHWIPMIGWTDFPVDQHIVRFP